jgi:GNAT superfamily N-acetyltransferase
MSPRSLPPVRRALPRDAAPVAAIYSATLGEGYLSVEEASVYIRDRSGRTAWFVAEAGDRVVAAANALWIPRREMPHAAPPGFEQVASDLLRLAPTARRFGLLENVAVVPAYRRQGFAAALTDARLNWLREQEVELVYTFAWHTPEGVPAGPTLERAGFRAARELPDFYLEDGLRNGYSCPWHGARCHCSALLCVRELEPPGAQLETRREMGRPGGADARRRREAQGVRPSPRERASQAATQQMCRMGAPDPSRLSAALLKIGASR